LLAPPQAPPTAPPVPPREKRSRTTRVILGIAAFVVAFAVVGYVTKTVLSDPNSFDPATLHWQTYHDAQGRYAVDMPGTPAVQTFDEQGITGEGITTGDAVGAVVIVFRFPDGVPLTPELQNRMAQGGLQGAAESGGISGFRVLEQSTEGDATVGRFTGQLKGRDVVGYLHVEPQGSSMVFTITFGVTEEAADTKTVHDRVVASFRMQT
jgi:hypothetical protein